MLADRERWLARRVGRAKALAAIAVAVGSLTGAQGVCTTAAFAAPQFYENGKLIGAPVPTVNWGQVKLQTSDGTITCEVVMAGRVNNENGHGVGELTGMSASSCSDCELGPELCAEAPKIFLTGELPARAELREAEFCKEATKKPTECPETTARERGLMTEHVRRRASGFPWKLEPFLGIRFEEEDSMLRIGQAGATCYPKETVIVEGKEVEVPARWEKVPAGCVKLGVVVPQVPVEFVYYGRMEPQEINGVHNGLTASRMKFLGAPEEPALQLGGGRNGSLAESVSTEGTANLTGTLKFVGQSSIELIAEK